MTAAEVRVSLVRALHASGPCPPATDPPAWCVQFLNFALWGWLTMALGFLTYEFVQKLVNVSSSASSLPASMLVFAASWCARPKMLCRVLQDKDTVRSYNTVIINTVMGGICFSLISGSMCCHFHRLYQARKFKKVW